ncbi:hypothetical protein N5J23_17485 [Comamonas aquatica]|uniref:Uncharacterized protein n=1 Tax=Comamonas aquatica TaxID=225991 RepID=A0AA43AY90_9BURK|nr:hypothetical protein [Comamonas aquatica]MDH1428201.1 hypothetical protein [Comamonas aquatica]MDH1607580.1 hypothetical protein [Comamonas aquatica]MDH1619328.1 hypothetical protein [Comamonas aquatica]MDH2007300.1 hypothetical protein [Comamonas aquatica]
MAIDILLYSARELTDDEAGGHGNRWGVFEDDVSALIGRWLGMAVEKSEVPTLGIGDNAALEQVVAHGEPTAVALLYTGQEPGASNSGLMSLIHVDAGGPGREPSNQLCSAFPFLVDGIEVEAEIEQICIFPNRIEARLELSLVAGGLIEAFDPCFWQNRAVYRSDERYRFVVSALAYRMGPASALEHVIDDEHEIRRFRARDAWVKAHGHWTREDVKRPRLGSLSRQTIWNPSESAWARWRRCCRQAPARQMTRNSKVKWCESLRVRFAYWMWTSGGWIRL